MQIYYYCRNRSVPKQAEIDVTGGPSWGLGAHYRSDKELASFGNGAFQPELIQYEWNVSGGVKTEFIWVDPGVLTASMNVFEEFSDFLSDHIVKYQIKVSDDEFISFRPRHFEDLMDEERSVFRLSNSGDLITPKKLYLKSAPRLQVPILGLKFRAKEKPFILVSGDFKEVYDELKCSGLSFQAAWNA